MGRMKFKYIESLKLQNWTKTTKKKKLPVGDWVYQPEANEEKQKHKWNFKNGKFV